MTMRKDELDSERYPVEGYMSEHVGKMRDIRKTNNDLWMGILDLALKYAPGPARELVRRIRENDMKVAELFDEIAGC